MIKEKYKYATLEQLNLKEGRRYKTPAGDVVPSVTTILSQTGDKSGLDAWRKWVGDEKANKELKEAAALGTLMHEHLESFLLKKERPSGSNFIRVLAKNMSDVIINRGLNNITEVWGIEKAQYFPELYAGTADLIGIYKNKECIADYKSSKKAKKKEHLEDYKIQCCAYALAHNEIYNTKIKTGVIFIISRDLYFETVIVEGLEFRKFSDKWLQRVEEWYKINK